MLQLILGVRKIILFFHIFNGVYNLGSILIFCRGYQIYANKRGVGSWLTILMSKSLLSVSAMLNADVYLLLYLKMLTTFYIDSNSAI